MKRPDFQTERIKRRKNKDAAKSHLNMVMIVGYVYCISYILHINSDFNWPIDPNMYFLASNIGECICLLICTVLISIIYYNVRHKRIFIHTNANLIKGIGTVVMFGNLMTDFIIIKILPEYARYTSMNHFSIVMGLFIIAIGYVFQEAIKMKEEQDLTI